MQYIYCQVYVFLVESESNSEPLRWNIGWIFFAKTVDG